MKKIFSLLVSISVVLSILGLNVSADDKKEIKEIHISDVEDWNMLAKECTLDTYSNNLKVVLDNDISFAGETFNPLPYFNGEFCGFGFALKDISVDGDAINFGLIRISCQLSYIHDLKVEYSLKTRANRSGFVGYNQGRLENIVANASIDGESIIGLIAGYNSVNGTIINCMSYGEVLGKHYVGGIVGTNYGRIERCKNNAKVNTVVDTDRLDIESLTLETLINSENVAAITDIGGVAGTNFGVISNCTNYSKIGYEHVGYNVGGIAGTQSGYLEDSTNFGVVKGRKEVGGIVGQQEPNLMIKYSEDHLQKMKRQIKSLKSNLDDVVDSISELGNDTLDYSDVFSNNLSEAYRAIETMLGEVPSVEYDPDDKEISIEKSKDYETAKSTLSSSMTKFFDSWKQMINANRSNVEDIGDSLNLVNEEVENLGNTAVDAVDFYTSERDLYLDVSDKDNDKDKDGKLKNCINHAYVEGDINVGGVVGSIAKENNLDPEDDFDISGTTSSNFTYQMRAVVDNCQNKGRIKTKKNRAGGIVGNQTIGLIKRCINYGLLDCEDADYVGGIVGFSAANIKDSYSKCFIWGDEYVGGVAGVVTKASGNGSLAQIREANTNIGSLFGNYSKIESELVQETSEIINNWYVYDEYAGIDGISYFGKAYKISDEEMLNMNIDDSLKVVYVYFLHDDNEIRKYTLKYGQDLDMSLVPVNVDVDNSYGYWEGFIESKIKNITRDQLFINELNDVRPAISSNEDVAYIVFEGNFSYNDYVVAFSSSDVQIENKEGHTITYSYNLEEKSNVNKIRVYCFGYDNFDIYVKKDGEYKKINPQIDGSYAVIDFEKNIEAISIVKLPDYELYLKVGVGVGAIVAISLFVIKKKKRNKK